MMNASAAQSSARARVWWLSPLFLVCVAMPTLLAILYFGALASDVYISESRFIVRGQDKATPTALGLLLNNAALSHGTPESAAAQSFLMSRDALAALNHGNAYARAYTRPAISAFDRFDPLGLSGSFEDLYKYYEGHVRIDTDSAAGITVLSVRAYDPADARTINEALLRLAESTVNHMSQRAREDLITSAQREVIDAKATARAAGAALAAYRNSAGVIDPEKQAPIQYELVSRLQDELIQARSDRRQLIAVAPQSEQITALDARIHEVEARLAEQTGLAAGNRTRSLAAAGEQYQRLALDADFAAKRLAAALASLEAAENEAQRKTSYVERIVEPNQPDKAIEPRRWRGVATTLVFSLIVWGVVTMLVAGIREHGQ
jgi:capsular polysaccharide transport system permease protein